MTKNPPPKMLADLPYWLVWRLVYLEGQPKPRKVPFYVNGEPRKGTQGTDDDRAQLVTYEQAAQVALQRSYAGVGFALQPDAGMVALDFDNCVEGNKIAPHVEHLCEGTYTEFSPSGTGVRAFFRGTLMSKKDVNAERGAFPIEVFGHNGFVTFTGNVTDTCSLFGWDEEVAYLTPAVLDMYKARGWDQSQAPATGSDNMLAMLSPTLDITDAQVADSLQDISPDLQYDDWVKVGMAVHHQTFGKGFDLWHNWSKTGASYKNEADCKTHWASFGRYTGGPPLTFAWVKKLGKESVERRAYDAKDEMQAKIKECDNEFMLRTKIAPEIAKDTRLDKLARNILAQTLAKKFTGLGSTYPIAEVRKMLAPAYSGHASEEGEAEDAEAGDVLNARLLAGLMQGKFMHEHGGTGWRRWDGGAWVACTMTEEIECAKTLGPHILTVASGGTGFDSRKAAEALKLSVRAMTAPGIEAALKLARSDSRVRASPQQFAGDPDMLNTENGLLHLPTSTLQPHHPSQMITRRCAAPYVAEAECVHWQNFLNEISCHDEEWIDFLWRACGYTIGGSVSEEVMFFLLGRGANGKSVVANILRRVLNTYATSVPASFLAASKRDGEAATPSLASLPGARLALANEVEAGTRLSAQTVKVACSTEAIAARHNYGDPFTFVPSHKLWVRGNHKPIITDNDDGIWRRIILIPFERDFAPQERDLGLEAKLMSEAAGILAWIVRGHGEYRRRGLRPSGRIAAASATYRKESDLLGQWLDEQTTKGPVFEAVQGHAYADYQAWCGQQGLRAMAKKSFTRELVERGIGVGQGGGGARARTYVGFKLNTDYFFAQDAPDATQIAEAFL